MYTTIIQNNNKMPNRAWVAHLVLDQLQNANYSCDIDKYGNRHHIWFFCFNLVMI